MSAARKLRTIKVLHTVVWAFFAGCIIAIPIFTALHRFRTVTLLAALVLVEVSVLAINSWRCPLTDVAARYTDQRQDNFDIYLPLWLARHNKSIFGTLFVLALGYAISTFFGHGGP